MKRADRIVNSLLEVEDDLNLRWRDPRPISEILADVAKFIPNYVQELDIEWQPNPHHAEVQTLWSDAMGGLHIIIRADSKGQDNSGFNAIVLVLKQRPDDPKQGDLILPAHKELIVYGMPYKNAAEGIGKFIDRAIRSVVKGEAEPEFSPEQTQAMSQRLMRLLTTGDPEEKAQPPRLTIAQQIDALKVQIANETDPVKREELKQKALRLMAQEESKRRFLTGLR